MVVKVYVDTNTGPAFFIVKAPNLDIINNKIIKVLSNMCIIKYSHEEIIEQ